MSVEAREARVRAAVMYARRREAQARWTVWALEQRVLAESRARAEAQERADRAEERYAPARRVVRAWTEPGPYPAVHRAAQRIVRKHMPVLSRQLDALARRFPEG